MVTDKYSIQIITRTEVPKHWCLRLSESPYLIFELDYQIQSMVVIDLGLGGV